MMRRVLVLMLSALSVGAFSSCQQPVMGSMSRASVDDLLGAERFAVTPCTPGWMLEKSDIFELGADEAAQLRALLSRAPLNEVSEEAYRTSDACALGKTSDRRFYLYASNAQCMEAHLVDGSRVEFDDLKLSPEDQVKVYRLLRPQLRRLFPGLR